MAEPAADYHRGEMDISEQTATYSGFLVLSKWGSLAIIAGILFFTLWLCAGSGFVRAALATIVLLVLGVVSLRNKAPTGH
jgi:O-antigen ligase